MSGEMIYINQRPTEAFFACRVHGDDMKEIGIGDNSVAVCRKQETAEDGDIVVSILNGAQTVRKYKRIGESVLLCGESNGIDPIIVTEKDDFAILGKVVEARTTL